MSDPNPPGNHPTPNPPPDRKYSGRTIGHYLLLDIIGEGGFGIVWRAQRIDDYHQIVALKMIKPGMGSDEVLARFEHERQALALMSHPAVAAVLDGGVTPPELGDRPYFVMEFVPGKPITDYCDEHRLSVRERLELFELVCEGVQHAHSKGIIHRDLTPRNILVVEHDNKPQPKIIDFGISKALGRPLTDKVIFTHDGRMMGVPEYISPEQAQGLDVDTRADVYSLGVLLYELLTGAPPFDRSQLLSRGWEAMLKFIREAERPHPSTRLSELGESAHEVARCRGVEQRKLTGELARGLGWIPLKALEPERNRRYQTPLDFAIDIRRYLNDDYDPPFGGRPIDRARRFIRRNRRTLAVAALIIITLSAWLAGTMYQLQQTRLARADAQKEAGAARAAEDRAEQEAYDANIAAAGAFLSAGDSQAARAKLERCDADRRRWEWDMLQRRAGAKVPTTDFNEPVRWVAFDHRDGALVALTSDVRHRLNGSDLTRLSGPVDVIRFRDGSERRPTDGRFERILGGLESGDRALLLHTIDARPAGLRILKFADGSREPVDLGPGLQLDRGALARAGDQSSVMGVPVMNEQRSRALLVIAPAGRTLYPLDRTPRSLTVSRDGRFVAAAWNNDDGGALVRAWEVGKPELLAERSSHAVGELSDLHIDSSALAAAGELGVAVWSLGHRASKDAQVVPGRSDVVDLDFARDWLAVGQGRDLRLHNLRTGDAARLLGHREPITSLAFSPRGESIVAASANSAYVRLWKVGADEFATGLDSIAGVWSDSSGSQVLLLGGADGPALRLFETATQTSIDLPIDDPGGVRSCAVSDDGSRFALLRSARVELWQARPPAMVRDWTAAESSIDDGAAGVDGHRKRIAFAPGSGSRLLVAAMPRPAAGAFETRILALDAVTGTASVVVTIPQNFDSVPTVLSASSPNVVVAASLFRMFAWSRSGGDQPVSIDGNAGPAGMAVSPTGAVVAALGAPGNLYLAPTAGGEYTESVTGHQPHGRSVVWLGNQERLATGASDGSIIIWATQPLRTLCVLRIGSGVMGMAYQPAEKALWVADQAGKLHRLSGAP